jgi:hypothetical protein
MVDCANADPRQPVQRGASREGTATAEGHRTGPALKVTGAFVWSNLPPASAWLARGANGHQESHGAVSCRCETARDPSVDVYDVEGLCDAIEEVVKKRKQLPGRGTRTKA